MNKTNMNFIVFVLVLFLICFLMNRNMREKFSNKFVYSFDIARTEPDAELVEISKDSEENGWKNYYRKNYLKGDVKYPDNFEGTVMRNYLDNLNFYKN
jgi:hypothetical protein